MDLYLKLVLALLFLYLVLKVKFERFLAQYKDIPGDPPVLFFGHSLRFMFKKPSEVFKVGVAAIKRVGGTGLFIMGFNARIFITDPQDVKEILSDRKFCVKSDFYDFLEDWLGNGVLLSNGQKCSKRRKIFLKIFHTKILEDFIEVFDKNSGILIENLKQFNGQVIDVYPKITLCAMDIICETMMGVQINAQTNDECSYAKAVEE